MQGNITLDRQAYQAMQFLKLQGETQDWIEAVLGKKFKSDDMYAELKSGQTLCKLMNTLFPGAIKKVHKSSFGAHQMENINFVLKTLAKMGMKEDELFEPGDLHDKKNMMKVFKCISTFANTIGGVNGAAKWKSRNDANFSVEQIDQWKKDYGNIEMEFKIEAGGDDNEEVELGPAKPDPVVKYDPSDFIVSETVTPKSLGVTLDELLKAVNKLDTFEEHADDKQQTASDCTDASLKAAQYAAQVLAMSKQSADKNQKKRLAKAYDDVDAANQRMVDAQNAYQEDPDDKATIKELHDACENMRRAAKGALDIASRRPAALASESDYPITRDVTNADIDVGLDELVKAVTTAKDKDGKKPLQTTEETEAASKKAAKFAAQIRRVGDQRAAAGDSNGAAYKDKMDAHADKISAANRRMVATNNEYVQNPDDKALARAHDEACDELIRAAQNAANDAKKQPPPPIKRAKASDFTISGKVTAADLDASLNDVLKSVKKVEGFRENAPAKTAGHTETACKRTAFLDAQLRAVAKDTKDPKLQKKLVAAYNDLEQANLELANANDVYTANDDDEANRKALTAACGNVKTKAAAAVDVAKQALESQKVKERPSEVQNVGNADIDAETTPLHFATLKGDMSAVRDLINKGMKVDATNAQGWTPLYTAAWVGNLELIRFFVKQGADVNVKNQEGWTPVFAAVAQGHKHVVKALAVDYKCDVNVQSNQGTTPLYHAAEGGRYSITKVLLDVGADTELSKKGSWKPIHGAVYNYHAKVTSLLIEHGAKLDVHNSELKDYTPLHIAISTKKPNLNVIEMLAAKADINAKNANGATPLHLAVMWGHEDVTNTLIKAGANLKIKNNKGRTALDVAVRNDHSSLANILAKKQGVSVPKLKKKKTVIGSIEAPDAPPPPPDQE